MATYQAVSGNAGVTGLGSVFVEYVIIEERCSISEEGCGGVVRELVQEIDGNRKAGEIIFSDLDRSSGKQWESQ